jgi:hypothetical protein
MYSLLLAIAVARPPANLQVVPLDEGHPAVGYASGAMDSFASSPEAAHDISQLERFLASPFETTWHKLVNKSQVAKIPWEGDYWPYYKDGINQRWAGNDTLSPVEKYAKAYGVDAQKLANHVSRKSGILSQSFAKKCKTSSECENGDECAIRRGEREGNCIPTWFGICHAWAPAAIVEKEPKCPVTFNNVTFEPMDMKALISQIYDSARIGTIFTGKRCNEDKPSVDLNGRLKNEECRDVSADFFHLVITNVIGKHNKSFVADVDYNAEVWNQPVRSYEILSQTKISAEKALMTYFPQLNSTIYTFNPSAKEILLVRTKFSYIVESTENTNGLANSYTRSKYYDYLLELDKNESIIGGEWVSQSKTDHVDFIWVPVGIPSPNAIVLGEIRYAEIKKLIELSQTSCSQ